MSETAEFFDTSKVLVNRDGILTLLAHCLPTVSGFGGTCVCERCGAQTEEIESGLKFRHYDHCIGTYINRAMAQIAAFPTQQDYSTLRPASEWKEKDEPVLWWFVGDKGPIGPYSPIYRVPVEYSSGLWIIECGESDITVTHWSRIPAVSLPKEGE